MFRVGHIIYSTLLQKKKYSILSILIYKVQSTDTYYKRNTKNNFITVIIILKITKYYNIGIKESK